MNQCNPLVKLLSFQLPPKWREVIATSDVVLANARAKPNLERGWLKLKMEETWRSLLPIMELNLHLVARVLKIGVVEYCLTSATGKDSSTKMLMKIKWNQRKEADLLPPYNECPTLYHHFIMNIIAWNYRGNYARPAPFGRSTLSGRSALSCN
nr:hypothetical protein CFP56_64468 [Quercus suber]